MERCESCWLGGNLKKKRTERDPSGSGNQPSKSLNLPRVEGPQWKEEGCLGCHPCHGPNGRGRRCEGERERRVKRGWRPARRGSNIEREERKRRRRRDLKAAGKCWAGALRP